MKKNIIIMASLAVVAALALPVGGCSGNQEFLGRSRQAPDEFAVYSRAPLSIPPDFSLRPPGSGVTKPQSVAPRKAAMKAVLGPRAAATPPEGLAGASPGTLSLIRQTGGFKAAPTIREKVDSETTILAKEDKKFADKIIFWRDKQVPGKTIDPAREERRIRDAKSKSETVTAKSAPAPTIQRPSERRKSKRSGFWGWLFN
jgi:hypothetical protein